jgi:hypothetical protein
VGKPETRAEKRIDAALDRWRDRLLLRRWDMTIRLTDQKPKKNGDVIAGEMDAKPRYKTMLVMVSRPWLESAKAADIEDTACHEVVHAVLAPLQDVAKAMLKRLSREERRGFEEWLDKENESVTTHFEHILRREARWPKR